MASPDREVWNAVLTHLRSNEPQACRRWFADLESLGIVDGAFGLRAHSDIHRDYLRRDCVDAFNDAVRTVTGQLVAVRFLGPEDAWRPERNGKKRTPPARTGPTERSTPGRTDGLPIDPDHDFEFFVEGPNNRLALAAAHGVCKSPGREYNPLFIHGGVGLGKTHLLQAICLDIRRRDPSAAIHYVSCEAFISHFLDAVSGGQMGEFRHTFRDVDTLVIDDIQFLAGHDRTQEEFFNTFNALRQNGKQIVLSADAPPSDIPNLADRLVSRFGWGLVTQIEPPQYETRVAIVRAKTTMHGLEIDEGVAEHVARVVDSNIRDIEGAIMRLQINANVDGCDIDLPLARRVLPDRTPAPTSGPTIETIIQAVADFYHVKRTEVLGKRRHKSISLPRQVCMYIARKQTRHSLEEIGAHFGGRDHTTVMHAVKTVESRKGDDTEFADVVTTLETRVQKPTPGR